MSSWRKVEHKRTPNEKKNVVFFCVAQNKVLSQSKAMLTSFGMFELWFGSFQGTEWNAYNLNHQHSEMSCEIMNWSNFIGKEVTKLRGKLGKPSYVRTQTQL